MKLIYAFPEPLPLRRARGIQAVNAAASLAEAGLDIEFAYVPAGAEDPFAHYGVARPRNLTLRPLSYSLPWPLARIHSNRLFAWRLLRTTGVMDATFYVRHLKLAARLSRHPRKPRFVYEAHEVFADTASMAKAGERRDEEQAVMRSAAAIVANSGATARRLAYLYGPPRILEVIPNGVVRSDAIPEKDWVHAGMHIVYSGSLFPWKGAADLVAAAGDLPGCRVEIIGGEPVRIAELEASVLKGGATVHFAGHLPHAEAMERVRRACIAVLPNRDDTDSGFTSPIKLFEYMAAGCAIVASDLPPMREILDEDDAIWSVPGDPHSLATSIRALVQDPGRARRMGDKVREKSRRYTWRARADRIKALLTELGGGR